MGNQYFRSANKNKIEAEKRIASFVIYYDKDELELFFNDFISSVMKSEFQLSKNMNIFINGMQKIFEENEEILNSESKDFYPEIILNEILKNMNIEETSEKNKENFYKWIDEIRNMLTDKKKQDMFLMGDDCCSYYYWQAFLDKVETINNSSKSFQEKLSIKLPEIESTVSNKIIRLDDVKNSTFSKSIYTTGVSEIDDYINFQPTNLAYIAARPSVGKSMFVLNMAIANAFLGIDSFYISLEMTGAQTKSRILTWIKNDEVDENEIPTLEASDDYKKINEHFYMIEAESMNGDIIYSMMTKFLEKFPKGIIFLDSVNLVKYTGEDDWGSLRHISRDLKKIALKYKSIVVACCLAQRDSEMSGVSLSNLYGASMLEADADIVIGLEPSSKSGDNDLSPILAKILKNRDGIKDVDLNLQLKKSTMHFYDSLNNYE